MAKAKKTYQYMVANAYSDNDGCSSDAVLFPTLEDATKYVKDELEGVIERGEIEDESYYIAKIVSSSKIAQSVVTTDLSK